MNKPIKGGLTITKTLIFNRTGNESDDETSGCNITFSDGSKLIYEIDDVDELEDKNKGIYEWLVDGSYVCVEDWEN